MAFKSRYERVDATVLVSFPERQEKWKLVQFQTVPALGRQEVASAILARPRGIAPIMVTFIICKQKLRGTLYADGAGW